MWRCAIASGAESRADLNNKAITSHTVPVCTGGCSIQGSSTHSSDRAGELQLEHQRTFGGEQTLLYRPHRETHVLPSQNDDCGQMSAWYIFSALGFYPVDPVSATYVVGT